MLSGGKASSSLTPSSWTCCARGVCVRVFWRTSARNFSVRAVVSSKRHPLPTATLRDLRDPDSQLAVIAAHNT